MRPELSALLADGITGHEYLGDEAAEPLFPEEAATIEKAVDKRKREFALGRSAARHALSRLGVPPLPLLSLSDRSVAWPDGFVGSITHADGYAAAIVAPTRIASGVGIDAERKLRVEERLWKQIANAAEVRWFEQTNDQAERRLRGTRVFSGKEAFYKAQYCVSRAWVGFHDVTLRVEDDRFEILLEIDIKGLAPRGSRFAGRQVILGEHVISVLTIAPVR